MPKYLPIERGYILHFYAPGEQKDLSQPMTVCGRYAAPPTYGGNWFRMNPCYVKKHLANGHRLCSACLGAIKKRRRREGQP